MKMPHNSVVLVADGRKMLFLRNEGDVANPNLVVERAVEQEDTANRDALTAPAGRKSASQTGAGSAMGDTDFHQIEEDRFAADATDLLKRRALAHEFESLIVVAPPRTLGEMRKHYHKEVSDRLAGELAKDLTNHPIPEIEKALLEA